MKYEFAFDLQEKSEEISKLLFPHIDINRIRCFRSYGSCSRTTIARCHALGKLMQKALGIKAIYALEFLSERFDKMSEEEQVKVIIHELMHIPFTFGGGFKHHDYVSDRNVNKMYQCYKKNKSFLSHKVQETQELCDKNKKNEK